ncbi:histidine phosphatase family protein [Rhodopirellula sp.]|nr:histidine phosphatase family protein [Rhodopirellula sp.]
MSKLKDKIASTLLDQLFFEGICSVSLVGSFCDKDDLTVISDIDTIVICEDLTSEIFRKCLSVCQTLEGKDLGFPGRKVYVNSTFGPLKFDCGENIVIHLMIYDLASHREHVNKSPFTCFDWERSPIYRGKSLTQIYPVMKLQYSDFKVSRRGINNYIRDLSNGVISYREYDFSDGAVKEVQKQQYLNARHKAEYAYHIIKNLVCNYIKMMIDDNALIVGDELEKYWRTFLPETAEFIPLFRELENFKNKRCNETPETPIQIVKNFIISFEGELDRRWQEGSRIDLIRHQRTSLNDGSFLGQGRDPGILNFPQQQLDHDYDVIYSSPLKRALQSSQSLCPEQRIITDKSLCEINYGNAEGLTFQELTSQYPEIVESWESGEDPRFPKGENSDDVLQRVMDFIRTLSSKDHLLVTHNVVIRCILGQILGIEIKKWHLIEIPHLEVFSVQSLDNTLTPNLETQQRIRIRDGISG